MRTAVLLALTAPVMLVACFGQNNQGGPPATTFDGGADASFGDATLSDDASGTDSAAPDSGSAEAAPPMEASVIDAPADVAKEAGFTGLEVLVTNDAGPESGVTVVVQDASGAVLTSATTDVTGRVFFPTVAANSQMTAVLGTSAIASLVTVVGVQPGDVIPVYDGTGVPTTSSISIDSVPANPPTGTATVSAQIGTCAVSTVPGSTVISASPYQTPCWSSDGHFPVLALAYGGADAGNALLGYAFQKGNQLATDGGIAHVAVGGAWTTGGPVSATLDSTGWPSYPSYQYGQLGFGAITDGVSTPTIVGAGAGGPGQPVQAQYYPGYVDFVQTEAEYNLSNANYTTLSTSVIATRTSPDAGISTDAGLAWPSVDLTQALPLLDTSSLDAATAAQPTVTFSVAADAGSATGIDGAMVQFVWSGVTDAGVGVSGTWTFVVPPGTTTLQAPALPATVSDWAPPPGSTFNATPSVALVEASFISGYGQLRAQAAALPLTGKLTSGTSSTEPVVPPLPVDGTLKLTAITVNGD